MPPSERKKQLLHAGDEITIQTGRAGIHMKKNGDIVIEGKKFRSKHRVILC